ncbi:MAG: sugar ABC transporter permease, partial [Anaerolineae bacterium]|nr:sugar ABC transporter permease [Anaerolineae bacterium]
MRKISGIVKFLRRNAVAYMFLTPWLLGFLVLTLYPMVYSLWLGFTDYDFTQPDSTQWIGLGNYLKMFGSVFGLSEFTASTGEVMRVDPYYLKSLSVTFTYVFASVPLKLIVALAVAMLMNQKLRGVPFYRAVYYVPTLLGGS